ncbi:MAG: hypothetical protein OCD76_03095 [Reichenbachiella sp.]
MTDCSESTFGIDSPDVRRDVYGLAWYRFDQEGRTPMDQRMLRIQLLMVHRPTGGGVIPFFLTVE